jgi:hypothetical protein
MKKLFQRLFGKKQSSGLANAEAKRVLDQDMKESKQTAEAQKKQGDHIPRFNLSNPDPELIEFAETFSQTYTKISLGDYYSDKKTYHIRYLKTLESAFGLEIETFMRVGMVSGIIEYSQKKLFSFGEKMTPDFVFYQTIWAVIQNQTKDFFLSDTIAMKYYLTTNRSTKNIIIGYAEMSRRSNMKFNQNRIEKLMELIRSIKGKIFS